MRLFLQAMSSNTNSKFKCNMQDISADKQIKLEKNMKDSSVNFDPQNPEGQYVLDLEEIYC